MSIAVLNQDETEAFADRMVDILNSGAMALMVSVGHRTGLFDGMAEMPPADSHRIAERTGLNERYVREWLGAMVTGGVVRHDQATGHYRLPAEHAACLTRDSAPDNLAAMAQYIPLLGSVEDPIVECFEKGGGVPYSAYPRFHQVMAEDSGQTVLPCLLDQIVPLVPELTERLQRGIDVLDVGCGAGRALNLLAGAFPNSRFTGYDLSEGAVATATAEAVRAGYHNILFQARDLTRFQESARYDLITAFDAIHDQADPASVLAGIAGAMRPGGVFLMQDIHGSSHVHNNVDHPIGPLLYTISCLHCMTVSLAQDGDGLGAMWGEEKAMDMLRAAGFSEVTVQQLDHDIQNSYYIARKAAN